MHETWYGKCFPRLYWLKPMHTQIEFLQHIYTGWERTVHVSRCPALYSGRIFVPLCRELDYFCVLK